MLISSCELVNAIEQLKLNKPGKTALQRLRRQLSTLSRVEFQIFYLYQEARSGNTLQKLLKKRMNNAGYDYIAGIIKPKSESKSSVKSCTFNTSENARAITLWKDILDLWDYVREGE